MPEALAMAGNASRTAAPRSRSANPRGSKAVARKPAKRSVLGRVAARPGVTVAGAVFAAVMTGIVVNAVVFQKGHHPSPLFGTTATSSDSLPNGTPVPLPPPVHREAVQPPAPPAAPPPATEVTPAAAEPAPAAPVATHPVKPAVKHPAPVHKAAPAAANHRDPIGQLIGAPAASTPKAHPAPRPIKPDHGVRVPAVND